MRVILWTPRARADLAAIRAFIEQDSPHLPTSEDLFLNTASWRGVIAPRIGGELRAQPAGVTMRLAHETTALATATAFS